MDDMEVMEGLEETEDTQDQLEVVGQPSGKGRARGRGRAARGKGAGKADGSSGKGSGVCFVCTEKKQKNSKFCRTHHRAAEAMKYQAQHTKPPETAAYNEVMKDSGKARVAIDEFLRDNPEGSSRKRLIDWTQWKREHGVRLAFTVREAEELLDIDDYWVSRGQPRGKTRQESDDASKELAKQHYDREGEGAFLKLWLPKVKERMKDRVHYQDASVTEGSRSLKDIEKKERDDMIEVCKSSMGDHASSFMRSVSATGALKDVPEEDTAVKPGLDESAPKRRKMISVADEVPRHFGKLKKDLPIVTKLVEDALKKLKDSVEECENTPEKEVPGKDSDAELLAYLRTAKFRSSLGKIMLCDKLQEAKDAFQLIEKESGEVSAGKDAETQAASNPPARSPTQEDADSQQAAETGSIASSSISRRASMSKKQGEQISDFLRKQIRASSLGVVVQDADALLSFRQMSEVLDQFLAIDTQKCLEDTLQMWKKSVEQIKLLVGGINKSSSNLKSHLNSLKKKVEREERKKKRLEEQKEVSEVRSKAKAAAQKVKDQQAEIPALFNVDVQKFIDEKSMEPFAELSGDFVSFDVEYPCIFKDQPAIDSWVKTPKIQVCLGNFGGRYKKTDVFTQEGKAQLPLYAKEGKEESQEFLEKFIRSHVSKHEVVSSSAQEFSKILTTLWLYGYSEDFVGVDKTPNGMAMLKVLGHGSMKIMAFECSTLLPALRKVHQKDEISISDLYEMVGCLTSEQLVECQKAGLVARVVVQEQHQAVWIPCGWIVAEQAMTDKGVLHYGLRSTFLISGKRAFDNYESVISMHIAAKKDVTNMNKVLALLNPDDKDDA